MSTKNWVPWKWVRSPDGLFFSYMWPHPCYHLITVTMKSSSTGKKQLYYFSRSHVYTCITVSHLIDALLPNGITSNNPWLTQPVHPQTCIRTVRHTEDGRTSVNIIHISAHNTNYIGHSLHLTTLVTHIYICVRIHHATNISLYLSYPSVQLADLSKSYSMNVYNVS